MQGLSMQRLRWYAVGVAAAAVLTAGLAQAAEPVRVGQPAPAFELVSQSGEPVALEDFAGQVVVLEWINPQCPFVVRHYEEGTMTGLAREYAARGVVWLAVNSTHTMPAGESVAWCERYRLPYPVLDDRGGQVGRAYGARTTPHMFVIDRGGAVVYAGGIDDDPRGQRDERVNYVRRALDEVLAGTPVTTPEATPYGCSVKYGS